MKPQTNMAAAITAVEADLKNRSKEKGSGRDQDFQCVICLDNFDPR